MIRTTQTVEQGWSGYDKTVAECQLHNYGVIFLDGYGCPLDDEYELEDVFEQWKGEQK